MGLHEGFFYESESHVGAVYPSTPQHDESQKVSSLSVDTRTLNDLWGPQIGAQFEFYCENHLWVNCGVKGALCNNTMTQETRAVLDNTYNTSQNSDKTYWQSTNGTTGVIDADLAVVFRPSTHISLQAGYQVMWMTGLALASRNFCPEYQHLTADPDESTWIDTQGQVLYHGPHIGVEVNW
jgi:hypothetical protein